MEHLVSIIRQVLDIGAIAVLPIIITILGLFFKMNFFKAFKSGLLLGIGFQGLKLVISLLITTIEPVTNYYAASATGYAFTTIDVGWQTLSAAAWMTPFAAVVLPLGLIVNIILIKFQVTKTFNIDIWNYWHILMASSILYYIFSRADMSGAVPFAICTVFAMLLVAIICIVGDKIAPFWQRNFGYEGTTCTTMSSTLSAVPVVYVLNKIVDIIPGVNKVDINLSWINKKLGPLGDPALVGFIVGLFLAIITRQTPTVIIQIAVGIAAVIVLMPRMVGLLMEGLTPISKAAKNYMTKHVGEDQELLIGTDAAFAIGDQTAVTLSLLLMPITIALAFIIPGNNYFPVGMFASIPYFAGMISMMTDRNLFRGLITGTLYMVFIVVSLNFMADVGTSFVTSAGVLELEKGLKVTAASLANVVDILMVLIAKLFKVL